MKIKLNSVFAVAAAAATCMLLADTADAQGRGRSGGGGGSARSAPQQSRSVQATRSAPRVAQATRSSSTSFSSNSGNSSRSVRNTTSSSNSNSNSSGITQRSTNNTNTRTTSTNTTRSTQTTGNTRAANTGQNAGNTINRPGNTGNTGTTTNTGRPGAGNTSQNAGNTGTTTNTGRPGTTNTGQNAGNTNRAVPFNNGNTGITGTGRPNGQNSANTAGNNNNRPGNTGNTGTATNTGRPGTGNTGQNSGNSFQPNQRSSLGAGSGAPRLTTAVPARLSVAATGLKLGRIAPPQNVVPRLTLAHSVTTTNFAFKRWTPFVQRHWRSAFFWIAIPTIGYITVPDHAYERFTTFVSKPEPDYDGAVKYLSEVAVHEEGTKVVRVAAQPAPAQIRHTVRIAPETTYDQRLAAFVNRQWSSEFVWITIPRIGNITCPVAIYDRVQPLLAETPAKFADALALLEEAAAADTVVEEGALNDQAVESVQ